MFRKSPTTGSFLRKLTSTGKKSLTSQLQGRHSSSTIPEQINKSKELDEDADECVFQ
jgi:hypothetical protein